jgi:hypothetical protein
LVLLLFTPADLPLDPGDQPSSFSAKLAIDHTLKAM